VKPTPPHLWRSVDEFGGASECADWLNAEFPAPIDPVDRRHFMKIMGATFAMVGLGACSKQPRGTIVPYLEDRAGMIQGRPLHFATALLRGGYATGVIVKSHEGRPTKVEGNPRHPSSLGGASVFEQAALPQLYDPDRSQTVLERGEIQTWDNFLESLSTELRAKKNVGGRGMHILIEPSSSPTLQDQVTQLRNRYPEAQWYQWEPASRFNIHEGCRLVFGQPLEPHYRLDIVDVIVALDSDFLLEEPDSLRLARLFARRRSFEDVRTTRPIRLYVAEPTMTITGTVADTRVALSPSQISALVAQLIDRLGRPENSTTASAKIGPLTPESTEWLDRVTADARGAGPRCVILAGPRQPAPVQAAIQQMNLRLGSVNQAIDYFVPATGGSSDPERLRQLCSALEASAADFVLLLGGDPVATAPPELGLREKLKHARYSVHWGEYQNDTAKTCQWHVPAAHSLESWSDARAADGTVSIVQPLIAPLYGGRSLHELLAACLEDFSSSDYELTRRYWQQNGHWPDFENYWAQALQSGIVENSATNPVAPDHPNLVLPALPSPAPPDQIEISFHFDPSLWDGRYANCAWLQELPRPISKVSWDNPAFISAALAHGLGLQNGDMIELKAGAQTLEIPAWIQPGQATKTISLALNTGRSAYGRVSSLGGFDTYQLRGAGDLWNRSGVQIKKLNRTYQLVSTQLHHAMEGREPVRLVDRAEVAGDREVVPKDESARQLINPAQLLTAPLQWGMVVNLNACIGCNACMIACQAENNISVVGKDQVWRGREMYWIRVDSYFDGDLANPKVHHQPVPCMHCETAPCELVCPVAATLHSSEGLNQQVYNRCIGTRFCSNNCPYKVRRFNFLQYADLRTPAWQLMWNPEVTVRTRGIMEKCTYCVQRIRNAEIDAEIGKRTLGPDEVVPACAQTCPAEAIIFGDIKNPAGRAARLKTSPLNYALLGQLNTRPRTTYLAKVKPELRICR
jgi:MoCo/4Fe-4S cofactor protein with predicted Tat translocation signal